MDHYVEIRLLPDPEFQETFLMNALFAKLHRALTSEGKGEIGVSFPRFNKNLGDTMRLHGKHPALERIMQISWLKSFRDHIFVSDILTVPENRQHRLVRRLQTKSSVERLYRRSVKKGWLTTEEADNKIKTNSERHCKAPYVQLKSSSTGQRFRLFIVHEKIMNDAMDGTFSSYGLSNTATIPWF